jgi:outer membrane protein, heavy metal efflux system
MPPHFLIGLLGAAVFVALAVPCAAAQTFEDLEARLADHPSLSVLSYQAEAERERGRAATALPDPVITLGINNFPIFDPSFDTFLPTNKAIGVSQDIPNFAERRARAQGLLANANEREAVCAQQYAALRGELILLLHHRHHLEQHARLIDAQAAKYAELKTVFEAEIGSADAALPRLAEAEAAFARLDLDRADINARLARIEARLRDLVGDVPPSSLAPPPIAPVVWSGHADQFHAVRVADAAIGNANARVDEARAAWRPDWGVELTYQQREAGRGGTFSNFAGDDWVSAQVRVSVPLWAGRSQAPRLRGAQLDRAAAQSDRMAASLRARSEYEIHDAARQRSAAMIDALNLQIAALEDQSRALLTGYESGSGSYAPVIESEIAILKLRGEIVSERALEAEAIARMNALLVTQ